MARAQYLPGGALAPTRIEPDIPLEVAALVGCGVTTGWGSATNRADVRPGYFVSEMDVTAVDEYGREFDKVTYRRQPRAAVPR